MIYCFRNEKTGEVIDISMTLAEYESRVKGDRIVHEGVELVQDVAAQHGGGFAEGRGDIWNKYWSDGLGCHPKQAKEQEKAYAKLGIDVKFCPTTGRAHPRDREHWKRMLKASGMHDRQGVSG